MVNHNLTLICSQNQTCLDVTKQFNCAEIIMMLERAQKQTNSSRAPVVYFSEDDWWLEVCDNSNRSISLESKSEPYLYRKYFIEKRK